ncbi:HEAT repeat domain-containing protein [Candidatus Poribacteria bacterium]
MRRAISFLICLALLWGFGCGGKKTDEVALAKEEFEAGQYSKAQLTLEQFIAKQSQNVEAQCLLAVVYSRLDKTQELDTQAEKLRNLGKPAMDKLASMMKYELNMAEDTAKVLAAVGEPAVEALIPVLGDATERIREIAISVLTTIGAPAAAPMTKALESPDVSTRAGAARVLGDIGDTAAVEPLTKVLADGNIHVRIEAATALYKLGDKSHADVITDGLGADLLSARRAAAVAMQNAVEEPPVEPLIKAARDTDAQVRAAAISALGKTKDARAVPVLIEALKAEDDTIRSIAADVLPGLGELAVMPLVEFMGGEQDEGVLYKVIRILGDIGDERAVGALEKVYAEDARQLLKDEAAAALNKIE